MRKHLCGLLIALTAGVLVGAAHGAPTYAASVKNARLTAVGNALDAAATPGKAKVYNGTQPASACGSLSGNTLLATVILNDPAGTVSGGVFTIDNTPVPEDTGADASGTPTFIRWTDGDDNCVMDTTAGVGSGDVNFSSALTINQPVRITNFTITHP